MVSIPTSRDVGRVSTRSGRIAPSGPSVNVGEGIAQFGNALTQVAYDLNDLRTQEAVDNQRKAGFDLETKIAQFRDQEEQAFLKAREGSSESGIGFTRQFIEGYQSRANAFGEANFEGLDEGQKARAKQSLMGLGNSLYGKAYGYEQFAKTRFYDRTTNAGLDTIRAQIKNNAAPYEELKRQGLAAIDSADMPEPWKAERRALWDADAAESKWQWKFATNPEQAVREIRGQGGSLVDKIVGVESGGNATAKNPNSSATGAGQFLASTWMNMVRQYRPDLAEGRSAQEVLALRNDPNLSREMVQRYAEENQQFLRNQGIEATDGNTYLAHFLGPRGAAQVLKADPSASVESIVGRDVVNANGFLRGKTSADLRAWADKKMGGAGVTTEFDAIPYERREQLGNWGEAEYKRQQNEERAIDRSNIEIASASAPLAIQNTGQYTGYMPTSDDFIRAYGPQEGAEKHAAFMSGVETSQQAFRMQTMSEGEIEALLGEARPTSTGEGAAAEAIRYERLSQAAEQTIKAREADPSAYVQRAYPRVGQAWQQAAETGDYRTALSVTAAAQQQLGIQNMRLLPKNITDQSIATFKDETKSGEERISAVTGLVFATSDPQQQRAIFNQLVDAGLPDTTEGAIEAYARGDQGAGRRLMEAATVDPSKLPGVSPFKPAEIDAEIQAQIMDEGQVGDIVYGLTDGTIENQERAIRDSKLLTNAVSIRVRNGETLEAAVTAAAKDLYGDVQAVSGNGDVNAQIVIPADADPAPVLDGLAGLLPTVRSSLENAVAAPDAPVADGSKAVVDAARANYIDNVMAEGYFRNAGDGYVFIDPFVGAAVTGPDGQLLIFKDADLSAAPRVERPVAPNVDDIPQNRPQTPEDVRRSEYGRFADMPEETPERPAVAEPEPVEPEGFNPGPIGGGGGW